MGDKGHEELLNDIEDILDRVKAHTYHDFKGELATPKMFLVSDLERIIKNAKEGIYDNEYTQ